MSLPAEIPIGAPRSNAPTITLAAYQGYRNRGAQFLAALVAERRANGNGGVGADGIDTDVLEHAFDGIPNKYSVIALECFIFKKCFLEGLGKDTVWAIIGAYTDQWDNEDGGLYQGPYSYCDFEGLIRGNPARAPEIRQLRNVIAVRHRLDSFRRARQHAESITPAQLAHIMEQSDTQALESAMLNLHV